MVTMIPKDFVILLSGVSCVGKTTTAYNILKQCPEFKMVTELDIVRLIVREAINDVNKLLDYYNKENVMKKYDYLFSSLTDGDYVILEKQAKIMQEYIKILIQRQQKKKIPTIIEGMSIIPELFFCDNGPQDEYDKNLLFINLYISNEKEHIKRRETRCNEREYTKGTYSIKYKIENMKEKNNILHNKTVNLSKKFSNVFSIDVSYMNQDEVTCKIIDILYDYLNKN